MSIASLKKWAANFQPSTKLDIGGLKLSLEPEFIRDISALAKSHDALLEACKAGLHHLLPYWDADDPVCQHLRATIEEAEK